MSKYICPGAIYPPYIDEIEPMRLLKIACTYAVEAGLVSQFDEDTYMPIGLDIPDELLDFFESYVEMYCQGSYAWLKAMIISTSAV